jgi:hypothetical protein
MSKPGRAPHGGPMAQLASWLGSEVPNLPCRPIAVVCHDAGAAHLILPWLDDHHRIQAYMEGPARLAWRHRFPDRALVGSLEEAVDGSILLISGTGWASDLEHRARVRARADRLRSVAVLDHWINYPHRFVRDGAQCLPDELWVTDDYACAFARSVFPGIAVRQWANRYLAEQIARIGPAPGDGSVLYVLAPTARAGSAMGESASVDEWQALEWFLAHRYLAGIGPGQAVRLRPHPSDPPGRYDRWLAERAGLPLSLDRSAGLDEAISLCDWVAGCESMAMVVGLAAGRRVVGTLPPWAPACRLPHLGLIHLRDRVDR